MSESLEGIEFVGEPEPPKDKMRFIHEAYNGEIQIDRKEIIGDAWSEAVPGNDDISLSFPTALQESLHDDSFFEKGKGKGGIPERYFDSENEDAKGARESVESTLKALRGGSSLEDVVSSAKEPHELAALKLIGVRLLQDYRPDGGESGWSEVSESDRRTVRIGEMLVQAAEAKNLENVLAKSADGKLDERGEKMLSENAPKFLKQYQAYIDNPDVPDEHKNMLGGVMGKLDKKFGAELKKDTAEMNAEDTVTESGKKVKLLEEIRDDIVDLEAMEDDEEIVDLEAVEVDEPAPPPVVIPRGEAVTAEGVQARVDELLAKRDMMSPEMRARMDKVKDGSFKDLVAVTGTLRYYQALMSGEEEAIERRAELALPPESRSVFGRAAHWLGNAGVKAFRGPVEGMRMAKIGKFFFGAKEILTKPKKVRERMQGFRQEVMRDARGAAQMEGVSLGRRQILEAVADEAELVYLIERQNGVEPPMAEVKAVVPEPGDLEFKPAEADSTLGIDDIGRGADLSKVKAEDLKEGAEEAGEGDELGEVDEEGIAITIAQQKQEKKMAAKREAEEAAAEADMEMEDIEVDAEEDDEDFRMEGQVELEVEQKEAAKSALEEVERRIKDDEALIGHVNGKSRKAVEEDMRRLRKRRKELRGS